MAKRIDLLHCFLAPVFLLALLCTAGAMRADDGAPPAEGAAGQAEQGTPQPTLLEALSGGEVHLSLRYRLESVDQDAFDESAEASTLRTILSYRTADWKRWSLFLEAEDVTAIFDDDGYNNAGAGGLDNGVRGVPVIADPEITDLNQAYLRWKAAKATLTLGRQEILLGDQRFISSVGWRQNHQSFDAARLQAQLGPRVALDYTFADAVHRIFGDSLDLASHLLQLSFSLSEDHRLTAYGFYLDFEDRAPLSTVSYGLEYTGKARLNDRASLRWQLETARQEDAADNPARIEADYRLASLGGDFGKLAVDAGWEVLGGQGDGARSFQTPLALLHAYNGWADQFGQTPSAGLEDLWLRLGHPLGESWRLVAELHDFSAESGSASYGTEIDAELAYKTAWGQTIALKVALYDADSFSTDTRKVMFWSSYGF